MTGLGRGSLEDERAAVLATLAKACLAALLLGLATLALAVLTWQTALLTVSVCTLLSGGVLRWSYRLARGGNVGTSVRLTVGTLLTTGVGLVLLTPRLWPLALPLTALAALVGLPYWQPASSRAYFVCTWIAWLLLIAVAEHRPPAPGADPPLPLVDLAGIGAALGILLAAVWQQHGRLAPLTDPGRPLGTTRPGAKPGPGHSDRYRALLEHLPDTAVLTFDHELRCQTAEGALLGRLGVRAEDLAGGPVGALWAPDQPQHAAALARQALDGMSALSEQQRGERFLQVRVVPLYEGGTISGGMAVVQDVTERRTQEQTLRDERDFAMTLTATMGQGLSVTDAEGRYVYVNPAFARMTSYTPEQLIGQPVAAITPDDERERLRSVYAQRSTGEASTYEMRMRCADGREIYALISGTPRFRDGQYIGSVAVITDLTERRRMERALQDERDFALSVMNTVGQGLLVTDTEGRYEFVNPAAAQWLGYEREAVIGKTGFDFTFPEDWPRLAAALTERRRGIAGSYEMRMRRADGTAVYGLVTGAPRLREGRFAGTIVTVADLTERKRAEAALAYARDEALAATRLKSEFLATMSHELRTPLNTILGFSQLLLESVEGALTTKQATWIRHIATSADHLLALINDILDLSKIEAGRLELLAEPVRVADICQLSLLFVQEQARKKALRLALLIDDDTTLITADPKRLKQILVNLLTNAVKFTPDGGAVSLEARVDAAAATLYLTVQDTGIGIAPEDLGRLFQPFSQIDSRLGRKYEGTGLGLVLVRRLAELHGGSCTVESTVGVGSRFTISLPTRPPYASPAP